MNSTNRLCIFRHFRDDSEMKNRVYINKLFSEPFPKLWKALIFEVSVEIGTSYIFAIFKRPEKRTYRWKRTYKWVQYSAESIDF